MDKKPQSAASAVAPDERSNELFIARVPMVQAPGLIGEARCLRRGASLAFSQGEIRDDAGKPLATATGTMKLIARK